MTIDLDSAMAFLRDVARQELGSDDDLTCFRLATARLLKESAGGIHRVGPVEFQEPGK